MNFLIAGAVLAGIVFGIIIGLIYIGGWRLSPKSKCKMAMLGSGGHTGEMLSMLQPLKPKGWILVYGMGDNLSLEKASHSLPGNSYVAVPRARKVGQSWISSLFSSLNAFWECTRLIYRYRPHYYLCNGPGTCLILAVAIKLMIARSQIIYVESLARVETLSLTGKLLYKLKLADRFLVQWPQLAKNYPGTEYVGFLV